MTKLSNYLVTVTEAKEILSVSYGQTIPSNTNRIPINHDTGGFTIGTVGATPTFCLADNSPILSGFTGKCPVYQDFIPRTKLIGIVNTYIISATGGISSPVINCTRSEFSYLISVASSQGATTGTFTLSGNVSSNITLIGTSFRAIYFGSSLAVAGVDYSVVAYNGNPSPYAVGYIEIQLLKPIVSGTPYNIIFNAQFNTYSGTFALNESGSGTDGCYGPFNTNMPNASVCVFATTTTTTTLVYRNVTLDPRNSLVGSSYTVYINGIADTGWKTGTRSYVTGTIIRVDYTSIACGVVLNNVVYVSGTNTTISVGVASYTWTLFNANNWTSTGFQCIGNLYYTNQVNDCGGTRQIQTYPGSTCDCICNQSCTGTYYGPSVCGGGVSLPNSLIQYEYYTCNNNPTGNYQVIENCSCTCNQTCSGTYQGTPYCVGNERRVDDYWVCNNAYISTTVISSCSCDCNQNCNGTYWEYYCVSYGVAPYTRRRRQKYYCNNANTGVDEFVTDCSVDCGANTVPLWQPSGSYSCYGTCNKYNVDVQNNQCALNPGSTQQGSLVETNSTFCYQSGLNCCGQSTAENWVNNGAVYCSSCNEFQPQINNNVCSSTYNSTRNVDLGLNSNCSGWPTSYYCEGYDYYSKETNICTGAVRNITLVQVNSPSCGYCGCTTWNIIAYTSDEYVDVSWTNCGGGSSSTSFYSSSGGIVGSVCTLNGNTPSITSGNGAANNTGNMCC